MNILIATHGGLAKSLSETVHMIIGDQIHHNLFAAVLEDSVEQFESEIRKVRLVTGSEPVLILTDMFGATPFNVGLRVFGDIEHLIITGVNIPMLIAIMMKDEHSLSAIEDTALEEGINGIKSFSL